MKKSPILTAITFVVLSSFCFSDTLHVPADYPSIQAGIDAAVAGDMVLVASGTYFENIDFKGKEITVKGLYGPEETCIDGGSTAPVVLFVSNEGLNSLITGFHLTHGRDDQENGYEGGGISCIDASPTIAGNIIDHSQFAGHGIHCRNSSAFIDGNTIKRNAACGIYCEESRLTITNNTLKTNVDYGLFCESSSNMIFTNNTVARNNGGLFCRHSKVTITGNTIFDNFQLPGMLLGYGIHCYHGNAFIHNNLVQGNRGGINCVRAESYITSNVITDNSSGLHGGGLNSVNASLISNNIICGNSAELLAGGILSRGSEEGSIVNNFICSNSSSWGAGLACVDGSPIISNNTIVGNTASNYGGGIYCSEGADVTISNTIAWGNVGSPGPEIWIGSNAVPSTVTISFSNIKGGQATAHVTSSSLLVWGSGMIDMEPLFVNGAEYDFHLTYDSPCRNAGDNGAVTARYDFEGDPRIDEKGVVDIGADEFYTHLYCTGNFTPSGSIEGKFISWPGTTPTGLLIGSRVMDPPLQHIWGDFYLGTPWFLVPLVPLPANGVLVIPEVVPTVPSAPYDIPMQALLGDKLTNLFILEVR